MMALYYRNKTGKGQYIDIAQTEILMRLLFITLIQCAWAGGDRQEGNTDPTMVPAAIFKTADKNSWPWLCYS